MKGKIYTIIIFLSVQVFVFIVSDSGAQSLHGTHGLFYVPTAEMMADKSFMIGLNQIPGNFSLLGEGMHDNRAGYATLTFLPRVEVMFRYTHIDNWRNGPYGTYFPDRMVSVRFQVLKEKMYQPAVLFGFHDLGIKGFSANSFFGANYIALSKNIQSAGWEFGLHTGVAFDLLGEKTQTMKGPFGGLSVSHSVMPWTTFIFENDSMRFNTAVKLLVLKHLQLMVGLMELKYPAGGIGLQFRL